MPTSMTALFLAAMLVAAPTCSQDRAASVVVVAEHEAPVVASTYRLDELRALARQARHLGRHPVLGFYASTFGYTLEPSETNGCPSDTVVRLMLGARHVEVPSDALALDCQPEAIARHYLLHAAADDLVLSRLARRVQNSIDRLPGRGNQVLALANVVDSLLPDYDAERLLAFSSADDELELGRLRNACRGDLSGSL